MSSVLREQFDILVVGGGPAGMTAAARAGECGHRVGIVDDNIHLGGQIWRPSLGSPPESDASVWSTRLRTGRVKVLRGRVFHRQAPGVLLAENANGLYELQFQKLILATGAREKFLPFPGWTLPNVVGAGGLQAMVKSGLSMHGKRVVVCGSGPLLLAVAAYLRKQGAHIALVAEQASWSRLARFGLMLSRHPRKVAQALGLKRVLMGVEFHANCWPVAAHGKSEVTSVSISCGGQMHEIDCDYLACGFHLAPNLELPLLLGCQVQNGFVRVDDFQQTTGADIFCAGEPTGISGVESSLVEGQIAGLAAAGNNSEARSLFPEREGLRRFARALDRAFELRSQLRSLPSPETMICRCEDVSYSSLRQYTSWREAKLQSRCGMGPCQGRVCGLAVNFLLKWDPDSVRPPIFPVRLESLARVPAPTDRQHVVPSGGLT